MYHSRLDICYVIGLASRFQSNQGKPHWKAVKKLLRYIKGTANYSFRYQGGDLWLIGYVDADWKGYLDERKSTSQ